MKVPFPETFVARYREILGAELEPFLEALQRPLRKAIRVNRLKVDLSAFLRRMRAKGWQLEPVPWARGGFWVERPERERPLGHEVEHIAGLFYVQEAASMVPAAALEVEPGMLVLDLAAAPGGKTLQMAEEMGDRGFIVANDVSLRRIRGLVSNVDRLGASCVAITRLNGNRFGRLAPNFFDRVLVDAPCSAEGTARKDARAMEWWSMRWIQRISGLQKSLLLAAYRALRPGGVLVYSTCTMTPEENEEVVLYLLEHHPEAQLEEIRLPGLRVRPGLADRYTEARLTAIARIYPHLNDTEGFVVTRIRKPRPTEVRMPLTLHPTERYRRLSAEERRALWRPIQEHFGFPEDLLEDWEWVRVGKSVYLWPPQALNHADRFPWERMGLRLCAAEGFPRPSTVFLQRWGKYATRHRLELHGEKLELYLRGKDFPIAADEGHYLVFGENLPLGLALVRGGVLKNQLPRELRVPD